MKKIVISTAVVVLLIIAGVAFMHSPRYSLLQIRKSIEQGDSLTFYKYVAVHEVAASVVDAVIDKSLSTKDAKGWLARAAVSFVKGLANIAKPALTDEVEQQIRLWFQGESSNFTTLLDIITMPEDVKFKNIAWVEKFGHQAEIGIVLAKPQTNETFMLKIQMRDMGSFWQIYEVENYGEFLSWLNR